MTASEVGFDRILDATEDELRRAGSKFDRFLRAVSDAEAICTWMDLAPGDPVPTRREITRRMTLDLAQIDAWLESQVNAILHHPSFQRLEASWRGVEYLTRQAEGASKIRLRLLDVSWKELARDTERAIEFDQSQLFKKVYSEEFGTPGGEPFGVLLGDYFLSHRPRPDQPVDDLRALQRLSMVSAAAFAPFIASAHPALFGVDTFADLARPIDLERVFEQSEYIAWRAWRDSEDSRFVGLTVPRILMRLPYRDDVRRADGFPFKERVSKPDGSEYLWGNACFAFGAVLIRAFKECGWLADIRGVEVGVEGGGLVTDLPVDDFWLERHGTGMKSSTDLIITDSSEKDFADLGFIPLCDCQGTPYSAFYAVPSLQRPKAFRRSDASANARLSAMLQYIFCVSRFAHYVKMICRDRAGSYTTAQQLEDYLHGWLVGFAVSGDDASKEIQAQYPLREASVTIREVPGRPGVFASVIHLLPHFQLDQMTSSIRLVTEITSTN